MPEGDDAENSVMQNSHPHPDPPIVIAVHILYIYTWGGFMLFCEGVWDFLLGVRGVGCSFGDAGFSFWACGMWDFLLGVRDFLLGVWGVGFSFRGAACGIVFPGITKSKGTWEF